MLSNDVFRSLRFALRCNNNLLREICALAGQVISPQEMETYLTPEDSPEFVRAPDAVLAAFLDGLIYWKRGKDESRPLPPPEFPVSNNLVMKKLRVACQLRDDDMLALVQSGGFLFGKSELSAVLRKRGHANYRECGDQALRNFLKGLAGSDHLASGGGLQRPK